MNCITVKQKKLNGAALYYSITISIIISTILLATILIAYYNSYYINQDTTRQKLLLNAYSGIHLVTNNNDFEDESVIDLYNNGNDSIFISKKNWGLYKVIISNAFQSRNEVVKIALTGKISNDKNTSLYLTDKNEPLVITGDTKIIGDCYLPKSGIKRGYIDGKHYFGEKLIEGKIFESQVSLPIIQNSFIEELKKQFNITYTQRDSIIHLADGFLPEKIDQSFTKKRLVFFPKSVINITSNNVLKGNIIILSEYAVNISTGAVIEDIIFYAPSIHVESNFSGSTQLFATDSIIVGTNCTLSYPTSIAIINSKNKNHDHQHIKISDGTIISGNIFVEKQTPIISDNKKPSLIIEKNSVINGWVYVNGKVLHSGKIYGQLYCDGFLLKTTSSLYENHLLDAEINRKKLTDRFVYPNFIKDNVYSKTEIVKWLQ